MSWESQALLAAAPCGHFLGELLDEPSRSSYLHLVCCCWPCLAYAFMLRSGTTSPQQQLLPTPILLSRPVVSMLDNLYFCQFVFDMVSMSRALQLFHSIYSFYLSFMSFVLAPAFRLTDWRKICFRLFPVLVYFYFCICICQTTPFHF